MKVAVSYISSNYSTEETIELIDKSNADYIHVDLMDGKYVEVNNFEINDTLKLFSNTKKLLDIHLMVEEPEQYLLKLSKLNVDCITFHPKTTKYPEDLINIIKSLGLKAGIAINPDEEIDEFFDVDQFLYLAAFDYLVGAWDHFFHGGHNYSMYKNKKTGKCTMIYYDFDSDIGQDVVSVDFFNLTPNPNKDYLHRTVR